MRQLTNDELEAKLNTQDEYFELYPNRDSVNSRQGFTNGFMAGLEYQDKRIEALEAKIRELEHELESCDDNLMAYTNH